MTAGRLTYLMCDAVDAHGGPCDETYTLGDSRPVRELRRHARTDGWGYRTGDLCPGHHQQPGSARAAPHDRDSSS